MKQKNKVRPIDDYTASLVNEGVTIHTIDHIASMLAFWMRSGSLSAGDGLVAKCWDLSDAYKQVPLSDEAFHLDSTRTWQCLIPAVPQQRFSNSVSCLSGR